MEENMANEAAAEKVRTERVKRGWPQSQLAEIADVSLRTIQRLEKEGVAAFETLKAVASAFEIDVSDLTAPRISEKVFRSQEIFNLPRLTSGKAIADIIGALGEEDLLQNTFDQVDDKREVILIAEFFDLLGKIATDWYRSTPGQQVHFAFRISEGLRKLEKSEFHVFGIQRRVRKTASDKNTVRMATIFVVPSTYPKVTKDERTDTRSVPALLRNTALSI